jgi:hypothetical protein
VHNELFGSLHHRESHPLLEAGATALRLPALAPGLRKYIETLPFSFADTNLADVPPEARLGLQQWPRRVYIGVPRARSARPPRRSELLDPAALEATGGVKKHQIATIAPAVGRNQDRIRTLFRSGSRALWRKRGGRRHVDIVVWRGHGSSHHLRSWRGAARIAGRAAPQKTASGREQVVSVVSLSAQTVAVVIPCIPGL